MFVFMCFNGFFEQVQKGLFCNIEANPVKSLPEIRKISVLLVKKHTKMFECVFVGVCSCVLTVFLNKYERKKVYFVIFKRFLSKVCQKNEEYLCSW